MLSERGTQKAGVSESAGEPAHLPFITQRGPHPCPQPARSGSSQYNSSGEGRRAPLAQPVSHGVGFVFYIQWPPSAGRSQKLYSTFSASFFIFASLDPRSPGSHRLSSSNPHGAPPQKHRSPQPPSGQGPRQAEEERALFLGIKEDLGDVLGMSLLMWDRKSSTHFLNRWSTHSPDKSPS